MTPRPIIIDTDPGVDDAVAILLALASPELEVRAITTVAGNVAAEQTALNARKICELAGRPDLAVHAGCPRPLFRDQIFGKYSGSGGLGAETLPPPTMPLASAHAVDRLRAELVPAAAGSAAPVTLCCLGPLTNIAVVLAHDPGLAKGIERLVIMGGAFAAGGNRTPSAEFNFLADPHAAQRVMGCGAPITLAPLDLTHQALATPERIARIGALNPVAETVKRLLTFYDRNDPERFGGPGGPVHDACTVAWLLRPELFQSRAAWVQVETAGVLTFGHSAADWWGTTGHAPNVDVLTRLDADGFFALLTERLAAYGAQRPA